MKSRLFTGIGAFVLAVVFMISAVTAQEATPEPEATQEAVSPRPYLGVQIAASEDPDQPGVVILAVDPRSPAAEAGLEAGDIITAVNGSVVTAPEDVVNAIADLA
ncbi:MAG: PDZ domain-containing protein, partial [Anaerolinea sp.]|nr:PDZ domain-containing protein [Anaerolinea sp.]